MSRQLMKREPIDPEFAEAYATAEPLPAKVSGKSDVRATLADSRSEEDPLLAIKAIAERNQQTAIDRKQLEPGSFDQIENDLSNTLKLGWDILTR